MTRAIAPQDPDFSLYTEPFPIYPFSPTDRAETIIGIGRAKSWEFLLTFVKSRST